MTIFTKPINRDELVARARGTLRDTKPPISHIRRLRLPAQAWILAGLWLIATATLAYILRRTLGPPPSRMLLRVPRAAVPTSVSRRGAPVERGDESMLAL
jgi:hypothetical protein